MYLLASSSFEIKWHAAEIRDSGVVGDNFVKDGRGPMWRKS